MSNLKGKCLLFEVNISFLFQVKYYRMIRNVSCVNLCFLKVKTCHFFTALHLLKQFTYLPDVFSVIHSFRDVFSSLI
jgi:hypothetical protein